jgi:indole-3-glycerol phosphate synthase
MSTILDEIAAARQRRVEQARAVAPVSELRRRAASRGERRSFRSAITGPSPITGGDVRIIAEMKKASPSAGLLLETYRPDELAMAYEQGGAAAISVLTENDYFKGTLDHLTEARASCRLPVLRKDFILDRYQMYEAAAAGADAVLLIVAMLDESTLCEFSSLARELKMDALVEIHTERELDAALTAGAEIIGVNNRNLKTLEVSLDTSLRLRKRIPAGCSTVSESGIRSGADVRTLMDAGFDAMLVGEHFLRSGQPGASLKEMIQGAVR